MSGVGVCEVPAALIQSRDSISGTSEPNQPNTLAASPCGDGSLGDYQNTESLESFTVIDQTPPYWQPGGLVDIQASVYCDPVEFANDILNVYVAERAYGPPDWIFRGDTVCTGAGLNQLSIANVQLSPGVGNVAIRLQFQRGTGAVSCNPDLYNDHEDLVLYVSPDNDQDGLQNVLENTMCTDSGQADSDGDGLCDGPLTVGGVCAAGEDMNADGLVDPTETDPCDPDTDGDGMDDGWEFLTGSTCGLDPLTDDSLGDNDSDGLSNLGEYNMGSDPCDQDTDGDTLSDGEEVNTYGTDPLDPDTDNDGLSDGYEVNFPPAEFTCMAGDSCASVSGCTMQHSSTTGHNYLFCTDNKNWQDARDFCRSFGGDLVYVGDSGENQWIKGRPLDDSSWLGYLQDPAGAEPGGGWHWSHGNPYGLEDWGPGEPNDSGGNEDCADFHAGYGFQWNDADCGTLYDLVCEDGFALNPFDPDTDGDGMDDGWEFLFSSICGLDPLTRDSLGDNDLDGLSNLDEHNLGTDPCDPDTDDDGMNDYDEVNFPPTAFTCMAGDSCGSVPGCAWQTYGGHNYLFCGNTLSWQDARDFCQSYGGDLVAVGDSGENGWIKGQPLDNTTWMGYVQYSNSSEPDGYWRWSHGNPVGFEDWYASEPNNAVAGEDCANFYQAESYQWNDHTCETPFDFICEDGFALIPFDPDTDGDGLFDGMEGNTVFTNPNLPDTDGDGMDDGWEFLSGSTCGLDPLTGDSLGDPDSDGLSNLEEYNYGTDPCNPDTDGDSLSDGEEVNTYGTDPLLADTDGDGLSDYEELNFPPFEFTCMAGDSCASVGNCIMLNSYATGHNYLFCTMKRSWQDGRDFCRSFGGDLIAVGDDLENYWLLDYLILDSSNYWIGLNDRAVEGNYVWSHGSPAGFTYFAPGEPNGGAADNCIQTLDETEDKWDDIDCRLAQSFICEDHFPLDPFNPDTDGDGLTDGTEINAAGTNPNVFDEVSYPWAQSAPQLINYQGRLTDGAGQPLADGATVDLAFAFYGVESGATPLYLTVLQEDVVVSGGVYQVLIGSGAVTPGSESTLAGVFQKHKDVWIGVKVDADAEMTPRARIAGVPYALSIDLNNLDLDGDGHYKPASDNAPNDDCNDNNPAIHPGVTTDGCDSKDNDCDGLHDEDCSETPAGMTLIPAGCFEMGDAFNQGYYEERPVHDVCFTTDFYMDVHPVTNAEYMACLIDGGCTAPRFSFSFSRPTYFGDPVYDDFPVIYVSWDQATAYCAWAGKRLPTEAQWEYAARGGLSGKRYPWGDTISGTDANYLDSGDPWDNDTSPVEYYAPNGYGLYDMAGNVWEWVEDWYLDTYYYSSPVTDPPGPESGDYRVLRGSCWMNGGQLGQRISFRAAFSYSLQSEDIGFRCAGD
jgi:formylglycine-generating enzyme required for sulfatase activity